MTAVSFDIRDKGLADKGRERIQWACSEMPVLQTLEVRFARECPLAGVRMSSCLHITTETANLARILTTGGAELLPCASNLLSTQDNVGFNLSALESLAVDKWRPRPSVDEYLLQDGRRIRLLAEGRLVNLAAAEGHPAAIMDMGFANQALCVAHLWAHQGEFANQVHGVPREVDGEVARLKLEALGLSIDTLTQKQSTYLASWREGT
ncbi:adenosylhomocysteinase [Nitrosococcus wardiae]|uniref:S-adenosyl-L-homocysteine hydrolase NAD binding domain-containing protein n=1 Tax=Nitrosococcus wardiae TaxID=1814290 RepID=A0A4P7BY61_9GAMM|nr:adenosylhomocysteinase [Nitrosococcus wardiae]QBQ55113.1 hypothetical protein E3U44_11785 [Nitrosococcus wardiae]